MRSSIFNFATRGIQQIILPFCVMELNEKVENAFNKPQYYEISDLNDYVDSVLPTIVKLVIENDMDPMKLPEIKEGFNVRPLIISYYGQLELTNGLFKNLSTLRRSGDVKASYVNKMIKISANFGLDNLTFDYRYRAKIMGLGPTGGVVGTIKTSNIFCEFLVDFNNDEVSLQNFYLYNTGNVSIRLTGNILVDWLANTLISVITLLCRYKIVKFVERSLEELIQESVDELNDNITNSKAFLDRLNLFTIAENLQTSWTQTQDTLDDK